MVMVYVTQDVRAPRGTFQEKPLLIALLVTLTLSAIFVTFPQIDIAVSQLFYVEGRGFPASKMTALNTFRAFGQYFPLTLTIVLVFGLVLKLIYPSRPSLFPPRFTLYFASLFLLGPALLVNGIFKPIFDRPRPRNTIDFGGDDLFVHAWAFGAISSTTAPSSPARPRSSSASSRSPSSCLSSGVAASSCCSA